MDNEVWRDIPNYEGMYQVSDRGRVKSLDRVIVDSNNKKFFHHGKTMKQTPSDYGRLQVHLSKGNKRKTGRIHRLVLEAFVGPCPEGMEACHNNGDASDNRLENLRWDTHTNNEEDKKKHKTTNSGERHGKSVLTDSIVRHIKKLLKDGILTHQVIADWVGVHRSVISSINVGHTWPHVEI